MENICLPAGSTRPADTDKHKWKFIKNEIWDTEMQKKSECKCKDK